jgi:hypothetical protein
LFTGLRCGALGFGGVGAGGGDLAVGGRHGVLTGF